ncbi:MAG: rRNA (cytidine1402-2-O)-methyltransferase [Miltoncostaeaceae bacterium]|nr:rRNA (cytidine1402-2-O)-methyltransferase [Miltoncostaeaceae bacterium]
MSDEPHPTADRLGGLVVVATPIGNLGDLSPRAAAALRDADVVACEDTRRTAVLLRHAGSTAPMLPAHKHNEAARAADLVRRARAGQRVVLVSDAGMPGISDPGARIVRAAVEAGVAVTVLPGASAVETALVASGLPPEPFVFVGFFPRRAADRRRLLDQLAPFPATIVGFESPRRVGSLLAELAEREPERPVAVCRELTKLHEQVLRGSAAEVAAALAEPPRGEVTVVLGPAAPREPTPEALQRGLRVLLEAGVSPALTAEAAAAFGAASRNAAYRAALAAAGR